MYILLDADLIELISIMGSELIYFGIYFAPYIIDQCVCVCVSVCVCLCVCVCVCVCYTGLLLIDYQYCFHFFKA